MLVKFEIMSVIKVFTSFQRYKFLRKKAYGLFSFSFRHHHEIVNQKSEKLSSKQVRQLFLDYFIKEKNHTFIPSSPVFLNNDPSLLFVNAGMNQFRSLLLDKIPPSHAFSKLKRVANSQKCIRLSGKHNDLEDVGQDLHHHTFFEMLGNWSFGDYSKREACEMAWELLTKVYSLNPRNLYVTYYGGCKTLGVPADEECKNIWLNIGVSPDHILPFVKENFWEMAEVGPCGPCTEIHYDFLSSDPGSAIKRVNAGRPDLIEIWNLVFIQYNREQNGCLKAIPSLNVDTGMGFERITAVLQGSMSNYDTDIFLPLFKAIEKNFNIRPYGGKTGMDDFDGIDTAYRILADHSRMFSVSIADGLFPDSYDAGHILRKIIRRASYSANKVMKSRPGVLSSLVPVVAETLDFFPEVNKSVKEIIDIINEEEKLFHQLINKGRKARNKMISENTSNNLNGQQVYTLKEAYGLEEMVVSDLAQEINLGIDWEDYKKTCKEKKIHENQKFREREDTFSTIVKKLQDDGIKETCDSFKYNYTTSQNKYGVANISATVKSIVTDNHIVSEVAEGTQCYIVTDATNFYSEAGGQVSDIGKIFNEDFTFTVNDVFSYKGYIFHQGTVVKGTLYKNCAVSMYVDEDHRLACSQNHTATHLLNSVLRSILPYSTQRSSHVGPGNFRFGFSAKSPLNTEQLREIERNVNKIIEKKIDVKRTIMPFQNLLDNPKATVLRGEEYPETVSVISFGDDNEEVLSLEACCGTHVHNTSDIENFILTPTKSSTGSTRFISAVTGKQAAYFDEIGKEVLSEVYQLKEKVDALSLDSEEAVSSLLKEVKQMIKKCQSTQNAPVLVLKECEKILQDYKLNLNDILSSLQISDVTGLDDPSDTEKIKHKISEDVINLLLHENISVTQDDYKYEWNSKEGLKPLEAKLFTIIRNEEIVSSVHHGLSCQLVLDKTNFYSEEDDQASDIGKICSEDFVFKVCNVCKSNGYIFHDGYVEDGTVTKSSKGIKTIVNEEHRLACSQNHTALHLLNAVLKEELPYFYQLYAHAGPKDLMLTFSSKASLSDVQIEIIERKVNEAINENLSILKSLTPTEQSNQLPAYKMPIIKKSKDFVPTISIVKGDNKSVKSLEPCLGTHVTSTVDVGSFIITSSKSKSSKEKCIRAVTGNQAEVVRKDGEIYDKSMIELEDYVSSCLAKENKNYLELWDCLQDVKSAKMQHETDLPLLLFRKHQSILLSLSKKLTEATNGFVQMGFKMIASEMQEVLASNSDKPYIICNLQSVGDAKKIINYAIDNSQNKPCMYFAKDGLKSLICTSHVPKDFVHSTFSALLWINPVASYLGGKTRMLAKDPELSYSVICPYTENLDKAIDIANEYIKLNLNLKKL